MNPATSTDGQALLRFDGVCKTFDVGRSRAGGGRGKVEAVRDFSLAVRPAEIVGVVGESGAGKTTVGRMAMGLTDPTSGTIWYEEQALSDRSARQLRALRHQMHMIFQDPYQALHPGMTVGDVVGEPLEIAGIRKRRRREAALEALAEVKLSPPQEFLHRYPHELSGGQRQRVAFARALVVEPRCVVADEPTSMLDVSLRAGILSLVHHLRDRYHSAVLYITHDLAVAKHICDRIAVMKGGELVELGTAEQVIDAPRHDYTRRLLQAAENLGHA